MATRRRATRSSITGTIADLQRRVRYLQTLPAPSRLGNYSVTRSAIQPRAVSSDQIALRAITNDQVAEDAIKNENLDNLSVDTEQIRPNAITRLLIEDGEVVDGKLDTDSVNTANIKDLNVTTAKLQNAAVNESKIASNAVTSAKISSSAVTTAKLDNSAVTSVKISSSAVTTDKLADSSITNSKIGGGAVSTAKLANGSVTGDKIANRTINGTKIVDGSLGSGQISSTYPAFAVSRGLEIGNGLTKNDNRVSVRFGTTSTTVAPGSHSHTLGASTSNVRIVLIGGTYTVATSTHRHSVTSSSSKYKKNITPYELDDPKKLLKLNPVQYQYKRSKLEYHQETGKKWAYGYIAEEVEKAGLHEVVAYDKQGRADGVDYGLLSVFILELVKEQQKEIDSLREEIRILRSDNAS